MKRPKRLSATFVNTVNVPGRYGDGRGARWDEVDDAAATWRPFRRNG